MISQSDIDGNLACLPVFLAGCKELLVLPGATYGLRLWCVMEIFTFIQMGGERERITSHSALPMTHATTHKPAHARTAHPIGHTFAQRTCA